jgi:hypothetical protein
METPKSTAASSAPASPEPAVAATDEARLTFPDWSAPRPSGSSSVPVEEMLRLSEQYLPYVTSRPGHEEMRRRRKVTVEFVL